MQLFDLAVIRATGSRPLARCAARCCFGLAAATALCGGTALAQSVPQAPAPDSAAAAAAPTGLWDRPALLGDIGGLRSALGNYGITLGLQETSEVLGNITGGIRHGATYDGVTQLGLGIDTEKAFGITGGIFNVSALQIHGRNLTQLYLHNLQPVSGIEADQTTRLWELWYQQSLLGGKADMKVGQQSLDQEFMVDQYGAVFLNNAFGWSTLAVSDMPGGGPDYPLSALGVRVRAEPSDAVTVLAGVFDGNPAGTNVGDPQQANASGTNFNLHNGALFIAEVQYSVNQPVTGADGKTVQPDGLPGTYKLGAWYNSGSFADQQYDSAGLPLTSPASNGMALQHRGDYSIYALADQMVWRPSPDSARNVGVFARVTGAPGDRNLISFSMNAGMVLKAPFAGRDNDMVGLGMGYARYSYGTRDLDEATAQFTQTNFPVRSAETFLELTYQCQVAPWWSIQSDLQYVLNVAGGIQDPSAPAQRIGNEWVLGLRTTIAF